MALNRETLERLLIDRALGALSADVDELLASHLEHDRAADHEARKLALTVETTRQAFQQDSRSLPAFPAEQLRGVQRRRRRLMIAGGGAALSGAVAAGLMLGSVLFGPSSQTSVEQTQPRQVADSVTPIRVRAEEPQPQPAAAGFWSARRWRERAAARQRQETTSVRWISPVKRPQLEGET